MWGEREKERLREIGGEGESGCKMWNANASGGHACATKMIYSTCMGDKTCESLGCFQEGGGS